MAAGVPFAGSAPADRETNLAWRHVRIYLAGAATPPRQRAVVIRRGT